tara:strand:- start:37 stop:1221 length:1185 start_codon:yes stop_codon:yes gene_type:complete
MLDNYYKKVRLISLFLSALIILNYIVMFINYNKLFSVIIVSLYLFLLLFFFLLKIKDSITFKLTLVILGIIAAGSPPIDWDSWAIWLFHAKRIFIEENFFITLNNYTTLHNSYPLIVPSFMVSFSNFIQGWNLILPKFSIFLLYIPPLIYANAILNKKFTLILLISTVLVFNKFLFNGYIDGLVAIYFSLSVYLLNELFFEKKKDDIDYLILYCFLIILSLLKNEGFVLVLIILSLIPIKNFIDKKLIIEIDRKFFLYMSVLPYISWKLISIINGVEIDVINGVNFERINNVHIIIESFFKIFKSLLLNYQFFISFSILLLSFYFCKYKKLLNITLYCVLIYTIVLICVYAVTPYDLEWHLNTSSGRVMMSLHYIMILSSIFSFYKNNKLKEAG